MRRDADFRAAAWKRQPETPETYMGGMIELPDGSWIDPAIIVSVQPLDGSKSSFGGADYLPRVIVDTRDFGTSIIECSDAAGAKDLARWLATIANRARALSIVMAHRPQT